jgi:acyl carrier protein
MKRAELENKVIGIISDQLERWIDVSIIQIESNLFDDLKCDSLNHVEVVMAVEEEFGIDINDDLAESIKTVKDLVNATEKQLAE